MWARSCDVALNQSHGVTFPDGDCDICRLLVVQHGISQSASLIAPLLLFCLKNTKNIKGSCTFHWKQASVDICFLFARDFFEHKDTFQVTWRSLCSPPQSFLHNHGHHPSGPGHVSVSTNVVCHFQFYTFEICCC